MSNQIMKVLQQGETIMVDSQKAEGGKFAKRSIVLQEIGGKFENQYAATMLGNMAGCRFYPGDIVVASLRFTTHEHNGVNYQDITVQEIVKINN